MTVADRLEGVRVVRTEGASIDGVVVGTRTADEAGPALPEITDRRRAGANLAIGARLDPTDLDVATRLGSLTPADVGSTAAALEVLVSDRDAELVARRRQVVPVVLRDERAGLTEGDGDDAQLHRSSPPFEAPRSEGEGMSGFVGWNARTLAGSCRR